MQNDPAVTWLRGAMLNDRSIILMVVAVAVVSNSKRSSRDLVKFAGSMGTATSTVVVASFFGTSALMYASNDGCTTDVRTVSMRRFISSTVTRVASAEIIVVVKRSI